MDNILLRRRPKHSKTEHTATTFRVSLTHSLNPRRYNPCRVLADSRSRLQPSLSLALLFQFLTASLSASLITPSIHLRFALPTRFLPSGLSKVIFLHGRLSCIRTVCPAHLSLVILTVVTPSYCHRRQINYQQKHVDKDCFKRWKLHTQSSNNSLCYCSLRNAVCS